ADGDFIVTWESSSQDGSSNGVYAQRYDSSGSAVGGEFLVNTTTYSSQSKAKVAMDDDGGFIIAWESLGQGVMFSRFDANGTVVANEVAVSTVSPGDQKTPAISMTSSGDFAIAWLDNDEEVLRARAFDANGNASGIELVVAPGPVYGFSHVLFSVGETGTWFVGYESESFDDAARLFGPLASNSPPTVTIGGPFSILEGVNHDGVTFTAVGSDPDAYQSDLLSYRWDLNDDGIFGDVSGKSVTVLWSQLVSLGVTSVGAHSIKVKVIDTAGAEATSSAGTLNIAPNTPPVANAGGPYTVVSGLSFQLNASASSDPDPGETSYLSYSWDINGDGVYGDKTGKTATVSWSALQSLGISAPDSRLVRVQVTDSSGAVTISDPVTLTVVANTPPVADAGGPYSIALGQSLVLSAMNSSDPDPNGLSGAAASWDINNDGTFGDATGYTPTVTWTKLGQLGISTPGIRTLSVRITDASGAQSFATASFEIRVNAPPVAVINGPYVVNEGSSVSFSASGSWDPDAGHSLSYSWDLNGDGVFGDATTQSTTRSWSQLQSLGINDGPGVISNVRVRVSDNWGGVTYSDPRTITINNAPPPAPTIGGATWLVEGLSYSYSFSTTDASSVDHAAGYTFNIDWDGDGTFDESVAGGSPRTLAHVYATPGNYVIRATATDKDGGVSLVGTRNIQVNPAADTAGGPYVVSEGQALTLYAYSTIDTAPGSSTYSWDVNGDGVFGDASGNAVTVSWTSLGTLGLGDGSLFRNISVRVTNTGTSEVRTIGSTLTVQNAAPTPSVTNPTSGVIGQS
ncbi:MAG: hypothetical protein U1D30_26575, partial [Planctomycetota bacterium]